MNVKVMENVYIYKGKMLIESFFFDSAICRNYSPASRHECQNNHSGFSNYIRIIYAGQY